MKVDSNNFVALADIGIQNKSMIGAVGKATRAVHQRRNETMFAASEAHGESLRQQAAEAKRRALRNLPQLLEQAETSLTANGIQVRWAVDAAEACQTVLDIAAKHNVQRVTKSKSMVTEEIALNDALESAGLQVVETDLGEYIVQLTGDRPSHLIAPIIHKPAEDVRDLFVEQLGMAYTDDVQEMVAFARQKLRDIFLSADMGVSGGNFIIAETGSLCLVMNEGNGRLTTAIPRVHVALVGIEKVIETVDDYATLLQVLARSATGQLLPVYSNIINAPAESDDGPEYIYVIFVDNGRSDMYASEYAESLACIRCGACLNVCPIYRSVGGHAYGWVYGGPIGSVVTPLLTGIENATPLPSASSLCGACKQVCPVNIDIPRMLLGLRADIVEQGGDALKYRAGIKAWAVANQSPRLFAMGGKAARLGMSLGLDYVVPNPLADWREHRDFPEFAPKPFRKLWQERQQGASK